ncbi:hypothetical protein ACU4GR_33005 [Methylobacterium oryzae CBMB20]
MSEDPVTAQRLRQGLPIFVALASILLVVATMAALYLGREILVPVTLAILLSFVLVPAVRMLRAAARAAGPRGHPGRGDRVRRPVRARQPDRQRGVAARLRPAGATRR